MLRNKVSENLASSDRSGRVLEFWGGQSPVGVIREVQIGGVNGEQERSLVDTCLSRVHHEHPQLNWERA